MFSNYAKGRRAEEELVRKLRSHGIPARRTPLSKAEGEFVCDIILGPCRHCAKKAAVQYRKDVPRWIYHGWPAAFFFESCGRVYMCASLETLWTPVMPTVVETPDRPMPIKVRALLLRHEVVFLKRIGERPSGARESNGWRVILKPQDRIYILSWVGKQGNQGESKEFDADASATEERQE